MELFATVGKGFQPLSIVSKSSILDAAAFLGPLLNLIVTRNHQEMIWKVADWIFTLRNISTSGTPFKSILVQCHISIPPENVRKPMV